MSPTWQGRAMLLSPAGQPSAFVLSYLREARPVGQTELLWQCHRHHCLPQRWPCRVWGCAPAQEGPSHSRCPGMRQLGSTWSISTCRDCSWADQTSAGLSDSLHDCCQDADLPFQNITVLGLCRKLQALSPSQGDSATGFSRSTHFITDLWKTLTPVTGNK